jgi:regulator of protease activity HflC (stomatin/prohibitin superfamily)
VASRGKRRGRKVGFSALLIRDARKHNDSALLLPRLGARREQVMSALSVALLIVCGLGLAAVTAGLRVVRQYERGVVFRFGRVRPTLRGPGLAVILPFVDRLQKVNMQIITMPVPAQDGITRDNVTVRVDAVVYFRVMNAVRAAVDVQDYLSAIGQVAQTSLRSIIGKSDLDDLLCDREHLNEGMELMIDSPALDWGIHIERVEIKDVALPEGMKRSMSRQAEAERERRARVIIADGELQASEKLADAAEVMAEHPAALQLRLLQTVVEVAAEKNSTLVLPFPVELLRFLERSTPAEARSSASPPKMGQHLADASSLLGDLTTEATATAHAAERRTARGGPRSLGVMPGQCG